MNNERVGFLDYLHYAFTSAESKKKQTELLITSVKAWEKVVNDLEWDPRLIVKVQKDLNRLERIIQSGNAAELGREFKIRTVDFIRAERLFRKAKQKHLRKTRVHRSLITAAVATYIDSLTGSSNAPRTAPDTNTRETSGANASDPTPTSPDGREPNSQLADPPVEHTGPEQNTNEATIARRAKVNLTIMSFISEKGASPEQVLERLSNEIDRSSHGRPSYERFSLVDPNSPYLSDAPDRFGSGSVGRPSISSWDRTHQDMEKTARKMAEIGFVNAADFDKTSTSSHEVGSEIVIDSGSADADEESNAESDNESDIGSEGSVPDEYVDWDQAAAMLIRA